jgi:antirestriction protein ArdC
MTDKIDKYELVTAKITELLERGVKAWDRPWHCNGESIYKNLVSGNSYSGINPIICTVDCILNEYESPYFISFKQASEMGWQVMKGAKSTWLRWGGSYTVENDEGKEERRTSGKWLSVFNSQLIDDTKADFKIVDAIAKFPSQENINPEQRLDKVEEFITKQNAKFLPEGSDRAFYVPKVDAIQLPKFESFTSAESYYATKLHELSHWTGHEGRLARDLSGSFGSTKYAYEELIAELASAFVCNDLGINSQLENHASYIDSWIQLLTGDKKSFFKAAAEARKAANCLVTASQISL